MDASGVTPKEVVPASRKLGRDEAARLATTATRVIVAKGKKIQVFTPAGKPNDEVLDAMLGPTGNLRAPTAVSGKTVLVGFNEDSYREALGL